jgi:hypothetical protein
MSLGTNYARTPSWIMDQLYYAKVAKLDGDENEIIRIIEKIKAKEHISKSTKAKYLKVIKKLL